MRAFFLTFCLGGALALGQGLALAQTAEIQDKFNKKLADLRDEQGLTELIEQVLKNNPDIRVAEVKLRQAEAELNRARMAAVHQIVVLQAQLRGAKAELAEMESRYKRAKELSARSAISEDELAHAALTVMKGKEKVAQLEAEQPFLVGSSNTTDGWFKSATAPVPMMGSIFPVNRLPHAVLWIDTPKESAAQIGKLRKLLQNQVKYPTDAATTLADAVGKLREFLPGNRIIVMATGEKAQGRPPFGPAFKDELPLAALIQWVEDQYDVRFVVRDYGVVVADRDRIPPGAVSLLQLPREPQPPVASPPPPAPKAVMP